MIDPSKVARKALERGLINRDQAERMTDDEAIRLLFLPGSSTAETITRISGRGVGLDVVRSNIEAIGGTIEVHSRLDLPGRSGPGDDRRRQPLKSPNPEPRLLVPCPLSCRR